MKKLRSLSLAIASLFVLNSSHAASFDDIQFWVGSGANQAALVLDWNDGKSAESLLWGYRWNGSASGADMVQAIVNADPLLFSHIGVFDFGSGPVPSILGLGYDLNNSGGFGVSPSLSFDGAGVFSEVGSGNANDARVATDNADHYVEGWDNGFWAYFTKSTQTEAWASSWVGSGDRVLTDGAWDGYSFAAGFVGPEPGEPLAAVAVPEPATFTLLSLSAIVLTCVRRKH